MDKKLKEKLMNKYPKIFIQKDWSPHETCMCWGITCSDGWLGLIDKLCSKIQKHIDKKKLEQVEAIQVKEKFGGLRFYVTNATEEICKFIYEAETESLVTCEWCGSKKDVKQTRKGYIQTLCGVCREK